MFLRPSSRGIGKTPDKQEIKGETFVHHKIVVAKVRKRYSFQRRMKNSKETTWGTSTGRLNGVKSK